MRLSIVHEIKLALSAPAKSLIAKFRLFPRDCASQHIDDWRIGFNRDCAFSALDDAYGNDCRTLHSDGPLEGLTFMCRGTVTTTDAAGLVRQAAEKFPEELYLRETEIAFATPPLLEFAREATAGAANLLDKPHRLMRALHDRFKLVETPAESLAQAFSSAEGAAQDMAHIMAAGARGLGLPARIVTGYLWDDEKGATQKGATQIHVWTEIHVAEIGWIGFDPMLCLCAHEGHVRLACGLDYPEAEPLRMAFYGGGTLTRAERIDVVDQTPDIPLETRFERHQSQSQSHSQS